MFIKFSRNSRQERIIVTTQAEAGTPGKSAQEDGLVEAELEKFYKNNFLSLLKRGPIRNLDVAVKVERHLGHTDKFRQVELSPLRCNLF